MGCLRVNLTNRLQQEQLGELFCIDSRRVVIRIGPADSGKTTDLCAACAAAARLLIPLATSAAGARKRLVGDPYQLGGSRGWRRLPPDRQRRRGRRAHRPAPLHQSSRVGRNLAYPQRQLKGAYKGWVTDMPAGLRSLLIASSSEEVTALNQRAHLTRITMKDVAEHGLEGQDGTTAALGD